MGNAIVLAILVLVIGTAVAYIIKAKKNGVKCIGCSAGGGCACGSADKKTAGCGYGCSGCKEAGNS